MNTCTCGAEIISNSVDDFCSRGLKCPDTLFGIIPTRPSWDDWSMALAKGVASRADCRRAQHGAVILDKHHRVVSVGYNGLAAGVPGCISGACPRGSVPPSQLPHLAPYDSGIGTCWAVHAEANSLLHADWHKVQGGTMAITGQPCHGCLVLIKGSGLDRAVWPGGEWVKS